MNHFGTILYLVPEGVFECETKSTWGILYWVPWLFLRFKDLIFDLQSRSTSNKCHLIIKAFDVFLFTSIAKGQTMSQGRNSEAATGTITSFSALHKRDSQGWTSHSKSGGTSVLLLSLGTDHLVIIYPAHHGVVLRCCRLTCSYPALN